MEKVQKEIYLLQTKIENDIKMLKNVKKINKKRDVLFNLHLILIYKSEEYQNIRIKMYD